MKMIFQTMTRAIDPRDGELKDWIGPRIEAISWGEAKEKIKEHGYLRISGVLVSEIEERSPKKNNLQNWN